MRARWSRFAAGDDGSPWRAFARRGAVILVLLALAVGAALLYSLTAEERYEAQAEILVTPLPDDPAFAGFGVLTGPRPAETAARLVESRQIADAVATRIGGASGEELLDSVDAGPVGDSNVIAVRARAGEGRRAAQVANGFVDELVTRRSGRFQSELTARIQRLREAVSSIPAVRRTTPRAVSLDQQLARLTPLVGGGDPTLEVVSDAVAPGEPAWPRPWLIVPLAALLALVLGGLIVAVPIVGRWRREGMAAPPSVEPAAQAGLAERMAEEAERRLAPRLERLEEATVAERAVAEQAWEEEVAERERALEERARELDARQLALEAQERQLIETGARLDERISAVTKREAGLARRAAKVAAAERRPAPQPATIIPPSSPTGPPRPEQGGSWNLNEIERLVAEGGERHPERREDWESYLFFLRDHAGPDGSLPRSFDWLIPDVFGDLLEREATREGQ